MINDAVAEILQGKMPSFDIFNSNLYAVYKPKDKAEFRELLKQCLMLNQDADLNWIDVSEIEDFWELFGKRFLP